MAILVLTASRLDTRRFYWKIALGMTSESFMKAGLAVDFYALPSTLIGTSLLFYLVALEKRGSRIKWSPG